MLHPSDAIAASRRDASHEAEHIARRTGDEPVLTAPCSPRSRPSSPIGRLESACLRLLRAQRGVGDGRAHDDHKGGGGGSDDCGGSTGGAKGGTRGSGACCGRTSNGACDGGWRGDDSQRLTGVCKATIFARRASIKDILAYACTHTVMTKAEVYTWPDVQEAAGSSHLFLRHAHDPISARSGGTLHGTAGIASSAAKKFLTATPGLLIVAPPREPISHPSVTIELKLRGDRGF